MAVAMSFIVANYADSLAEALTIVFIAGIIQVLLGALRIGSFVAYTPYSVVSGFMSGVGIVIVVLQVLPFLGPTSRKADRRTRWGPGPTPSAT